MAIRDWIELGMNCLEKKVGFAAIQDKIRETRLTWFGHIKRRSVNASVKKCGSINLLKCKRCRGQSKKSWNQVIKYDLNYVGLMKDMV